MDSLLKKLDKAAKTTRGIKLSQEELRQAVALLSTEDVKQRFLIGDVILKQGLRSLPELISAMSIDKPEIRRTAVYILGKLAEKQAKADQSIPVKLIEALNRALLDGDPKVRRNSVVALGDLKVSESVGNIVQAIDRETSPWVRPSMILALGAIGGPEVTAYLSSYQPKDSPERSALEKALDRSLAGVKSNWCFKKDLTDAIPVELWTVEGLEQVVAKGVKHELALAVEQVVSDRVRTSTTDACSLFELRTFTELLLPLAIAQINSSPSEAEIKSILADILRQENVIDKILSLHEYDGEQQRMRYRLEIRGRDLEHSVRRTLIREITDLISKASPVFVNSPSNYDIELRITLEQESLGLLLKPLTIQDNRFSYRVKDVPASINPAVAAGIMKLLPKLHPRGRILDPFCGSGTMLIERAFADGYKELIGIDISKSAIEAAEQNVKAAGLDNVQLINKDMRSASIKEPFDEIITNMPFGLRTGKHETNEKLYQDFFDMIPGILADNGTVILYTQEVRLTTSLFRRSKHLKLLNTYRVTSGGLRPAIFVGMKR